MQSFTVYLFMHRYLGYKNKNSKKNICIQNSLFSAWISYNVLFYLVYFIRGTRGGREKNIPNFQS